MPFIRSEDEALKNLLKGCKVSDEKNSQRDVMVKFANPDIEVSPQSYPYITIELLDPIRAGYRQTSGVIVDTDNQGTTTPVTGQVYSYEVPVPWDLRYQVVTYARHPYHDRDIKNFMLNRVAPGQRGYLPVKDDLGTHTGYRHLILEEFTTRDTIENGRRLYRSVFTLSVSSEGGIYNPEQATQVQTVKVNTSTTNIPPDLQAI